MARELKRTVAIGPAKGRRLMVGFLAADLTPAMLTGDVTCHALDIYHAHAIAKVHPGVKVVCTPHLPTGAWDEICFRTGPKLMSGELALDLLQEIHCLRRAGGDKTAFTLDYVGRESDRNDLLAKIRDNPDRVRNFSATWPASVPGLKPVMFTSTPGCFCHRRLDEGGLALAEVASRELTAHPAGTALRVFDMGCGCGLVGLLMAKRLALPETGVSLALTLVDSHTRAVEAAERNAAALGVAAEVVLADDGLDSHPEAASRKGTYDVFVGNPPYYSDYRIADVFLATAKKALKPGGVCYTVVRNAAGLRPVQERYFPEVEVIPRRGYAVLKSCQGQ